MQHSNRASFIHGEYILILALGSFCIWLSNRRWLLLCLYLFLSSINFERWSTFLCRWTTVLLLAASILLLPRRNAWQRLLLHSIVKSKLLRPLWGFFVLERSSSSAEVPSVIHISLLCRVSEVNDPAHNNYWKCGWLISIFKKPWSHIAFGSRVILTCFHGNTDSRDVQQWLFCFRP